MLTDQAAAQLESDLAGKQRAGGERRWRLRPSEEGLRPANGETLPKQEQTDPELKELVVEASRSLARWDADRLEELALSCQALNRKLPPDTVEARASLARQAQDAVSDMAVFARVLEATRANLDVMSRLSDLHAGKVEYSQRQVQGLWMMENRHGNH